MQINCLFNNSNNNNNILNDNYRTNNAFRRNKFSCYYYYLLLYFLLALNYAVRIYYVKCVSRMRLKNQPFLLLVKKTKITWYTSVSELAWNKMDAPWNCNLLTSCSEDAKDGQEILGCNAVEPDRQTNTKSRRRSPRTSRRLKAWGNCQRLQPQELSLPWQFGKWGMVGV